VEGWQGEGSRKRGKQPTSVPVDASQFCVHKCKNLSQATQSPPLTAGPPRPGEPVEVSRGRGGTAGPGHAHPAAPQGGRGAEPAAPHILTPQACLRAGNDEHRRPWQTNSVYHGDHSAERAGGEKAGSCPQKKVPHQFA